MAKETLLRSGETSDFGPCYIALDLDREGQSPHYCWAQIVVAMSNGPKLTDGFDPIPGSYDRVEKVIAAFNAHDALVLACNSAKNYILEHGDERTMAPVVEQLERAIAGKP